MSSTPQKISSSTPQYRLSPAGKTSQQLADRKTGKSPINPRHDNNTNTIAGKSSNSLNQSRAGRAHTPPRHGLPGQQQPQQQPRSSSANNNAAAASTTAAAAGDSNNASVMAGKSSAQLNTDRTGRCVAAGKKVVSEANAVIRGHSALPDSNAFVQFHIKRKILPNTQQSVIVPISIPSPVKTRPQASNISGTSSTNPNVRPLLSEKPLTIGGKSWDQQEGAVRHKKPVASPKRKKENTYSVRPQTKECEINQCFGEAALAARAPSGMQKQVVLLPTHKSGKHIERQSVPKQDSAEAAEAGVRFTRPPFWDEQSRPPAGHQLSRPTRCFKAPAANAVAGAAQSPNRVHAARKNESVVWDCFGNASFNKGPVSYTAYSPRTARSASAPALTARNPNTANSTAKPGAATTTSSAMTAAASSSSSSSSGAVTSRRASTPTTAAPPILRKTYQDHDGHRSKGWDEGVGRRRAHHVEAYEWQKSVPTLANPQTKCHRITPALDHGGKAMNGNERKTRTSDVFKFGGNWECNNCKHAHQQKQQQQQQQQQPLKRSSSAPPAITTTSSSSSSSSSVGAAENFKRSGTSKSTSLIESPFDRTCNPGKYDPTFESRQTCRKYVPYQRPLLKASRNAPVISVAAK